jgi:hypothetical protein
MTGLQMVGSGAAACEGDACLIPQPPSAGEAPRGEAAAGEAAAGESAAAAGATSAQDRGAAAR